MARVIYGNLRVVDVSLPELNNKKSGENLAVLQN
jgi:hypothetical protein